jgi:RNase adapter protein RapZ
VTPASPHQRQKVVLVTGLSGAGLSTALKALEDHGYEAIDNLRLSLLPALLAEEDDRHRPFAISIDSRTTGFSADPFLTRLKALRADPNLSVKVLFLDCTDEQLQRRFTVTRRRHPLATDRPVLDGIVKERVLLAPIKADADQVIDTSQLSLHDLRRLIAGNFRLTDGAMRVFVTSFSFGQGVPREADLVFDVRFLKNPHWEASLRPLTGQDKPVADYIQGDEGFAPFLNNLQALLWPLLPRFQQEGKSYLTIAVGCTGGRHRSVYVAERLAAWLMQNGQTVGLQHRQLTPKGD